MLRSCLEALTVEREANLPHRPLEVIVVDNASDDGSGAMVRQEFPWVRLIKNDVNLGYTRGCNQGIASTQAEYVLLLNPDCRPAPGAVELLAQHLDCHPAVGAVTGRLLYPDGRFQPYYRRLPTAWSLALAWLVPRPLALHLSPVRRYLMLDDCFDEAREVEQPPGACLMLRRPALGTQPYLDECFPLFFSDVEICQRLYNRGYRIEYVPEAVFIHHKGEAGTYRQRYVSSAEYFQSMIDYVRLRHGAWPARAFRGALLLAFMVELLLSAMMLPICPGAGRAALQGRLVRLRRLLRRDRLFALQQARP